MPQPYLALLARAETAIGELVLLHREVQANPGMTYVELLVDDRTLMSDYNTLSERTLARAGVRRCSGEGLRVLVGGLGLGHTAHEALSSPRVAQVDVIEFVPQVVDWFERGLIPMGKELADHPRVNVILDDVFARLLGPAKDRYDAILIDVDHAPDDPLAPESQRFYTTAGLQRVAAHLAPDGILAVWSCADSEAFEDTLRTVFETVQREVTIFEDDWFDEEDEINYLFFASSPRTTSRLAPTPSALA